MHCGAWFARDSLFCRDCENILWERHIETRPDYIEDLTIESLFHWRPDEDRQISKLLKSLKGGILDESFEYYAQEFLTQKKPSQLPVKTVLVPCPGKRPDHAWALAFQFSKLLSLPISDILEKPHGQKKHQKDKSKHERSRLRFSCQETMRDKHVIFIDDIVTTGASVKAARKAIGACQSFRVWALAQRVVSLRGPG